MSESKRIWTPSGTLGLSGKPMERVELKALVGEWLRQMGDVAPMLKLGLHCAICGSDVVGKNHDSDKIYTVTCGCREFVWQNRDWRPSASSPMRVQ